MEAINWARDDMLFKMAPGHTTVGSTPIYRDRDEDSRQWWYLLEWNTCILNYWINIWRRHLRCAWFGIRFCWDHFRWDFELVSAYGALFLLYLNNFQTLPPVNAITQRTSLRTSQRSSSSRIRSAMAKGQARKNSP